MGIKGIYGEIVGERVALSKLAADKFVKTGRPFRVAVDVSIWQYQVQSGKGGTNPALRTFYHRLVRLLSLSIQPIFVFDGPHKPPFKRGRRTSANTVTLPNFLMKQLLKLFGFPFVEARGEAEAEAALLQREGIVDAVFSEDVDTLMFGCGLSMRNWSNENARGDKRPTHVTIYDASRIAAGPSGLDREGMVLVALMSGGDYIPEGVPGCGIKVACEAARAGFGKSLLSIPKTDTAGFRTWRDNLAHELRTNTSKFFRVKHSTLQLPETFPNREVLGYYAQPKVSSAERIQKLKGEIQWDGVVDIAGLRAFVADAFEWRYKAGATKFITGLAPALLVWKLRTRGSIASASQKSASSKAEEESVVKSLSGKRSHFTTDGMPEVGVNYLPIDIVGLDLDAEEQGSESVETIGQQAPEDELAEGAGFPVALPVTRSDPAKSQKIWVGEIYVRTGVPLMFHDWEEGLRDRGKGVSSKVTEQRKKRTVTKTGMKPGALDPFLKTTKPGLSSIRTEKPYGADQPSPAVFIDPASRAQSQLLEELDIQESSKKPAKSGSQRSKGKENRSEAIGSIANVTQSRSRCTSRLASAKKQPNPPNTQVSPKSRSLTPGKCKPLEAVNDPRWDQCSGRGEPKFTNHGKSSASPKGSCAAFMGRRTSSPSTTPNPPNFGNTGKGSSGTTTGHPSRSKERGPIKHRSGLTAEDCIDLSGSSPARPASEHQTRYSAIPNFGGDGLTSAIAEARVIEGECGSPPPVQIFHAEDRPSSAPSPPPISATQPRHSPQSAIVELPLPSPSPPKDLRRSQGEPPRQASSLQPQTAAKAVRMIAPRESLVGAWREVDGPLEEARTRGNVFVGVEIIDMTDGL